MFGRCYGPIRSLCARSRPSSSRPGLQRLVRHRLHVDLVRAGSPAQSPVHVVVGVGGHVLAARRAAASVRPGGAKLGDVIDPLHRLPLCRRACNRGGAGEGGLEGRDGTGREGTGGFGRGLMYKQHRSSRFFASENIYKDVIAMQTLTGCL